MPFALCGGAPTDSTSHTGYFVIPQGEKWSKVDADGSFSAVEGPKTVFCMGNVLKQQPAHVASESEYLELHYLDGSSEVQSGPASVFEDSKLHKNIYVKKATSINNNEAVVVYREETNAKTSERSVRREVVRGPQLYKPRQSSEWKHSFSWHGHDPSGGELARKRPHGLKFEKLLLAPSSTYYDVENVRTADDALLTVRLMIFYKVLDVVAMMDATNDPIADIVNSVSADVISFCAARSFEQFKETSEQLNNLGVYQSLVDSVSGRGLAVSKVVFRGYIAPQRLQKMHDEAIERRTKLVLEAESEVQEQKMKDERLAKENEREVTKRGMQKAHAQHEAEMQRASFEATQREGSEAAQQETHLLQQRQETELKHLLAMQANLGLKPNDTTSLLIAREHGAPARLIQIVGDAKPVVQIGDGDDLDGGLSGASKPKAVRPMSPKLFSR